MTEPPPPMRGGIPFVTRYVNRLREFCIRRSIIPNHGFNETPGGIQVPTPPQPITQDLQWVWSVSDGQFSFDKKGGYIYIPLHKPKALGGDEDDEQLPTFLQFPAVPKINGSSVVVRDEEDTPPTLALTADQKNLIVLTVPLSDRFESIGEDQDPDDRRLVADWEPTAPSEDAFITFREKNYAWNGTDTITITKKDIIEYLSDTDDKTIRFLMGWVELDEDSKMTNYEWFAGHAPITLGRWSHVAGDGTTGGSARNPTGITAADYPSNAPPIPGV